MAIITLMITLSIYVLCSVVLQFLLASETARNNLGLALANCAVSGTETEALSREQLEKCRVMEALSSDSSLRWAISLLIGAILTSRSPASAISIVGEMRANGDFTKTALGVTIFMYLGVILLFSITQVGARARARARVRVRPALPPCAWGYSTPLDHAQAVSVILVGSVKPALLATNATLLGGSANTSATETYSVADMEDEASAANVGRTILALCRALCRALYDEPVAKPCAYSPTPHPQPTPRPAPHPHPSFPPYRNLSRDQVGLIIASVVTSLLLSIFVGLLLGLLLYGITLTRTLTRTRTLTLTLTLSLTPTPTLTLTLTLTLGIIGLPIRPLLKKVARLRSPLHEIYLKVERSIYLLTTS